MPLPEVITNNLKGNWVHDRTEFSLPPLMTLVSNFNFCICWDMFTCLVIMAMGTYFLSASLPSIFRRDGWWDVPNSIVVLAISIHNLILTVKKKCVCSRLVNSAL